MNGCRLPQTVTYSANQFTITVFDEHLGSCEPKVVWKIKCRGRNDA
jgi:hypothetical protein